MASSQRVLPPAFTCKECGTLVQRKPVGAKDVRTDFCGRRCQLRAWRKQHGWARRHDSLIDSGQKCPVCGDSILSAPEGRPRKYCSQRCGQLSRAVKNRKHFSERDCAICGALFTPTSPQNRLCSDECRREYARRYMLRRDSAKKVLRERECRECGRLFVAEYGNKRRVYCSEVCLFRTSKRVAKGKRKALTRGVSAESVNPLTVFRRDKWRCQLCGVKTPAKLRGSCEDTAPELDHIVPLALGGPHTYANTQCLCRRCNGDKGAKVLGQLRLA